MTNYYTGPFEGDELWVLRWSDGSFYESKFFMSQEHAQEYADDLRESGQYRPEFSLSPCGPFQLVDDSPDSVPDRD